MKRQTLALALVFTLLAVPAMAQKATVPRAGTDKPLAAPTMPQKVTVPRPATDKPAVLGISPGEVAATPEMWFYQQELQQYQDPNVAVRAKAEFRATQRARRMASLKWFGFSNQRPTAGSDPYHGEYSPTWVGGNDNYKFRWYGGGQPWIVARPTVLYSGIY